jgi:hypothetical protein
MKAYATVLFLCIYVFGKLSTPTFPCRIAYGKLIKPSEEGANTNETAIFT